MITYMLDTCICSFIMREQPLSVLQKLQMVAATQKRIVISAITYAEMRYGAIGKNDTAIAGHTISESCILVTNNTR